MKKNLFLLALFSLLALPAFSQQTVTSTPVHTIQPFDSTKPIVQLYCAPGMTSAGINMMEWQPESGLTWNDTTRTKTPIAYIDCSGSFHSSQSCNSAFASGCGTGSVVPGTPRYSIQVNNPLGTFAGGDFENVPGSLLFNSSVGLTSNVIIAGGQDGAESGTIGILHLRGGNQTATTSSGYSSSTGGGISIEGGDQASTSTSSQAGSVEVFPGEASGGGEQGVAIFGEIYKQGTGTVTQWGAECQSLSATMTVSDCAANPGHFVGVADVHTGSIVEVHTPPSVTPFSASAAVTLGHTVCLGAASPKITDSGSVNPCTVGITVGVVVAVTGEWNFPDGSSSSISTTLPMVNLYKTHGEGPGDVLLATSSEALTPPASVSVATFSTTQTGNIVASPVANQAYRIGYYVWQAASGSGSPCSTNSTATVAITWADPSTTAQTQTFTALNITPTLAAGAYQSGSLNVVTASGTALAYSITWSAGDCATQPTAQAQIWAVAE